MVLRVLILMLSAVFFFGGCQSASSLKSDGETNEDVQKAMGSITEAIGGQPLTEEELKNLQKQIREEPQAQSAVQRISDAMGGKSMAVKYCPVTGKRYAADIAVCPVHNVDLKLVEP